MVRIMRIVLIEDSSGDVRWFQFTLTELGIRHNLIVFETGMEALECFRYTAPPDLIVTGWRLPALSFEEFFAAVRAIPLYQSTPVAVITGVADLIRAHALTAGAICCLQKPVTHDDLRDLFSRMVRGTTA